VTPPLLTAAAGQALCSLAAETGYNCYAECATGGEVKWYASPCGSAGKDPCDARIPNAAAGGGDAPGPSPSPSSPPPPGVSIIPDLAYDPAEVYDLRGLQCELLNGKEVSGQVAVAEATWAWRCGEVRPHSFPLPVASSLQQCFYEDGQGRELCPSYVTAEWLAFPKDQYLCSAAMAKQYYCTVGCQEGNSDVRWGANEVAWCYDPKNLGSCPKRQSGEGHAHATSHCQVPPPRNRPGARPRRLSTCRTASSPPTSPLRSGTKVRVEAEALERQA